MQRKREITYTTNKIALALHLFSLYEVVGIPKCLISGPV
jgi:hypothetical protein